MDNNETPFYSTHRYGLMVDYRYFTEKTPSTGVDLGVLMLHQGSDFDSESNSVTLQPKRARHVRVTRLVRQAGAIQPQTSSAHLRVGALVKLGGKDPYRFDLENLRPVGSPLATPLPVIDGSKYADAKAVHGLQRKLKAMEKFEAARTGSLKPAETETVADLAIPLEDGLWACPQPGGGWLLIDEACKLVETPTFFDKREELDAMVAELRAN